MVTKGIIRSINRAGNRCIVRMPLFETASSTVPIEVEALVSITPGMFNNLFVNDVVFIAFEENALEKPFTTIVLSLIPSISAILTWRSSEKVSSE